MPKVIAAVRGWVSLGAVADSKVRAAGVPAMLRHTASKIDGVPRDRPWYLGPIRYGAMLVPRDITRISYGLHPLDGQLTDEAGIDALAAELLATEAEIDGYWAIAVFADVLDGEAPDGA